MPQKRLSAYGKSKSKRSKELIEKQQRKELAAKRKKERQENELTTEEMEKMGLGHMAKVYTPIPKRRNSKRGDSGTLGKDILLAVAAVEDDGEARSSSDDDTVRRPPGRDEINRKPSVRQSESNDSLLSIEESGSRESGDLLDEEIKDEEGGGGSKEPGGGPKKSNTSKYKKEIKRLKLLLKKSNRELAKCRRKLQSSEKASSKTVQEMEALKKQMSDMQLIAEEDRELGAVEEHFDQSSQRLLSLEQEMSDKKQAIARLQGGKEEMEEQMRFKDRQIENMRAQLKLHQEKAHEAQEGFDSALQAQQAAHASAMDNLRKDLHDKIVKLKIEVSQLRDKANNPNQNFQKQMADKTAEVEQAKRAALALKSRMDKQLNEMKAKLASTMAERQKAEDLNKTLETQIKSVLQDKVAYVERFSKEHARLVDIIESLKKGQPAPALGPSPPHPASLPRSASAGTTHRPHHQQYGGGGQPTRRTSERRPAHQPSQSHERRKSERIRRASGRDGSTRAKQSRGAPPSQQKRPSLGKQVGTGSGSGRLKYFRS